MTLHYQDKYIPVNFIDTRAQKDMKKIASDNWCDYYEVQLEMDMVCLRYQFELEDYEGQIFPSRFATSKQVEAEEWYQAPISAQADLKGDLRGVIDPSFGTDVEVSNVICHLNELASCNTQKSDWENILKKRRIYLQIKWF